MEWFQLVLAALSGCAVGFCLCLTGGGGSILALPLMVYVVGVGSPHLAIGTSAAAVAASALVGLHNHAKAAHVRWRAAGLFAGAGAIGALAGSLLLHVAYQDALALGAGRLVLQAVADQYARAFYERSGFVEQYRNQVWQRT